MKLYVPTTFTVSFIEHIKRLNNNTFGNVIDEVYGSLPLSSLGSARPPINLPQINIEGLAQHIKYLNKDGIKFSYLLNVPYSNHLDPIKNNKIAKYIDDIASILEGNDNSVTVASKAIFDYIKNRFNLRIIMSLVLNIKDKSDIEYFIGEGADKIVLSTTRNRNFHFLKICGNDFKGKIILMANESCLFDCKDRFNHFMFACNSSSTAQNKDSNNDFKDNYMLSCTRTKLTDLVNLIKSGWIRPEDVYLYENVGIDYIKLADRTKPERWLIKCFDSYIKRKSPINFFELIAITPNNLSKDKIAPFPKIHMDNKKLDNFIDYFYQNNIDCLKVQCKDCLHCYEYADKVISVNNEELSLYTKELSKILEGGT